MTDSKKKERTMLRQLVTRKVNKLVGLMHSLSREELQADIDILKDYESKLMLLDSEILKIHSQDPTISVEDLQSSEEQCEEYMRKIRVSVNQMTVLRNGAASTISVSQGSGSGSTVQGDNRTRIDLPKIQLPDFWADDKKDTITCSRFFETFEHLLKHYKLNEVEMFNLLERQCHGRAKAMITSLNIVNQTYQKAKDILTSAFSDEMPQKYSLIRELTELNFVWGCDDPFIYYSKVKKMVNTFKEVKIDLDTMLLYFIWSGLPCKFQDIIVSITNKSHPKLNEVLDKFLEASNRYLTQINQVPQAGKNVVSFATSLKASMPGKLSNCILCFDSAHKIAKCTKYTDAKQKLERLKELKLCFKCLKENHFSKSCHFVTSGKCMKCSKGKHWSFLCTYSDRLVTEKSKGENSQSKQENSKRKSNQGLAQSSDDDTKGNDKGNSLVTTNLNAISSQLDMTDSLLPVLTLYVEGNCGSIPVDTVLDVGSQNSFITSDLAEQLSLEVVDCNLPLMVKGINSTKKIVTKTVKFPVMICDREFVLCCICIPNINIHFKVPLMDVLIGHVRRQGKLFAYSKFNECGSIKDVNDIKLLIGARDWASVIQMKSGVAGPEQMLTAYYEIPQGLILVGSIRDWISNCGYLGSLGKIHEDFSQDIETTSSVLQVSEDYGRELETNFHFDGTNIPEVMCTDIVCDDVLDLASYIELDKACDMFLNVEVHEEEEIMTDDIEQEVTDFILQNSCRNEFGQHTMAIPWLTRYKGCLGSNEKLAFKVLQSVKRKHRGKNNTLERMDDVFKEQLSNNMIEEIVDFEAYKEKHPKYSFISHFPLVKDERQTTKVRVVYMANLAERKPDGGKGLSINQCVHPGFNKNLKIANLFTLMRFDKYLMSFDISKAYNRLLISEENSSKFLFYWFKDIRKNDFTPVVYRCTRVIFGLSVSPFLLQCALYKFLVLEVDLDENIDERLENFKKLVYQGSYVDNFFITCKDEDELEFSHDNAVKIFGNNGFPLQQFVTNSLKFQKDWDVFHNTKTDNNVKVLGMIWDRERDTVRAPKYIFNEKASTMRQILSSMKGAYDLQNTNLPLLNRSKLFLRKLQRDRQINWDDELDSRLQNEWRNIALQFNEYESIEIERFIGSRENTYSMIMFSDASKDFLGMVLYMKENETNKVSFICAQNKILDRTLQGRTMPVLEFLALEFAVQKGLEIYKDFTKCLVPLQITDIMLLTDSTIALAWLRKAEYLENKTQTRSKYLNNHIDKVVKQCREIHEVKFGHIGGNDNSADFTTRVVSQKKLKNTCFVSGPKFLGSDLSFYEWLTVPNENARNDIGLPRLSLSKVEVFQDCSWGELISLERFSTLTQAVKTLQYVKRFINRIIMRVQKKKAEFLRFQAFNERYKYCKLQLLRADQRRQFPNIFEYFESRSVPKKKIPDLINKMNIILDSSDGLLKVKSKMGKLTKGKISRTPILLCKESVLTKIMVMDLHLRFNHSGTYYLLHKIKPEYFIVKAYSAVKEVLKTCFHCKRFNSRAVRLNANDYKEWNINPEQRFFSVCFVDYFGPYITRYGQEKVKTYGVIFKCIWSKMINVEIVTCADTSNFLIAFQNHIYSYGLPQKVISDAGSNLTTAFSWIRSALEAEEVKEFLDQTGVKVCELEQYPKGSLNRGIGGIIESGVALMKKLIQGSIRNNVLDFQHFSHIIKQCVCYANKRPLSQQQALREQNPDDQFQVISPEYLKFGYNTAVLEVGEFNNEVDVWSDNEIDKDKFEKLISSKSRLRQHYHSEFLYGLLDQATRLKGRYMPVSHENISKGDIILIKDTFVKAPNYPLGKVLEVIYNTLGEATQVVLLKGNRAIVRRDISSVILLVKNEQPVEAISDENENLGVQGAITGARPKRQAAIDSREKTKKLIAAADV